LSLSSYPQKPGVYLFRNSNGKVIYVGKAINLRNRVSSYFSGLDLGPKTRLLVSQIAKIETRLVESELEALLLEAALIKKYQPKYNIKAKDDKSPLYIKVTREKVPLVTTARQIGDGSIFGPFPQARTVKMVLKTLRSIFPYRTSRHHQKGKCLYCHLGLCPGPLLSNKEKKEYGRSVRLLRQFLGGQKKSVLRALEKEMKAGAKAEDFEKAAQIRDQILAIKIVTSPRRKVSDYLKNPNLVEDQRRQELRELESILGVAVNTIEGYDVSNLVGKQATGAMVTFSAGEPVKSLYRRFRIKFSARPNDLVMISEVLKRRLAHSGWPLPDLILVDGGKAQVKIGLAVLKEHNFQIPAIGLAKRMEEVVIFREKEKAWVVRRLPQDSPARKLLERVRDEAHRFARTYHLLLRKKMSML